MAALQTAMFPILVICLPKREAEAEEKAETGRHLKRKARIRACSMRRREGGRRAKRKGARKGGERGRKSPAGAEFPVRFSAAPPSSSGAHKHFLSRGSGGDGGGTLFSISSPLHPAYSPIAKPFISIADSEAVRRNKSRLLYKCCQRE